MKFVASHFAQLTMLPAPLSRACFCLMVMAYTSIGLGDDPSDVEFFEKRIRPVLIQSCYECHSARTDEPEGGLRLDSRPAMLTGGDSGPAVVPG